MIARGRGLHDFLIGRSQFTGPFEMNRGFPVLPQLVKSQGQIEMGFRQIGVGLRRRFETALRLLPMACMILLNPLQVMTGGRWARHGQDGKRS